MPATSVVRYNPMDGTWGKAPLRIRDGQTEVYLQLASGESTFLQTFTSQQVEAAPIPVIRRHRSPFPSAPSGTSASWRATLP